MFDPNIAMQSMMIHETMRQQQNSMRKLNHMLEQENQRMLRQQQMARMQQSQREREEELYRIYYEDER